MIKKVWKRSESSGLDERLSIWMHKLDQWRKKYSYENPCHDQRMLREIILEYAADLETQANLDKEKARQLFEKMPVEFTEQNALRKMEALSLERTSQRFRTIAAALRLQVALVLEEQDTAVSGLHRRLRRLRAWLIGLSVAYVGVLAGFLSVLAELGRG